MKKFGSILIIFLLLQFQTTFAASDSSQDTGSQGGLPGFSWNNGIP